MKKNLLIIGASGHGKVVADIAMRMNRWKHLSFLDDNESIISSLSLQVIGKSADVAKYLDEYEIFVGIGNNSTRKRMQEELEYIGTEIPTLIHPSAVIGEGVNLMPGTVVMAGAVINCCSRIGRGCIINTGATVDHDNLVEDYAHISPGAHLAGTVKIGMGTWIGVGAVVSNNVNIAAGCCIGAGAVVIKDITEIGTYVGVPAKKLEG